MLTGALAILDGMPELGLAGCHISLAIDLLAIAMTAEQAIDNAMPRSAGRSSTARGAA